MNYKYQKSELMKSKLLSPAERDLVVLLEEKAYTICQAKNIIAKIQERVVL